VAAATGAVLAVLIGAGAALWQAQRATAERERAEQVKEFIASIMRDADPYARESGEPVDATDLLTTARSRVDRELADQPMVRLELLGIIGESFYGLRDNAAAAETLEEALRAAAAAPGADAGFVLHLRRVLSQAYAFAGRETDSRRELELVLDAYRPGARPPDPELIEARLHEATLDYYDARYPQGIEAAREALRLVGSTAGASVHARFKAHETLAAIYQAQEHLDLAVQHYQRAYDLALKAHGNDLSHPGVLEVRYGYANTLEMDGRPREALAHAQAVTTLGAEVYGPDSEMLGYFRGSLANIQLALGEIGAAVENSRKSLAIYQRTKQPGTRDHSIRMRLLSRELLAARQPREAAEKLAASLEIETRLGNVNGHRWSAAHYGLALGYLGRFDEAEAVLEPVVQANEPTWSRARVNALWRLGTVLRLQADSQGALSRLEQALAYTSKRPRSELDRGEILAEMGQARADLGLYGAAIESNTAALELLRRIQLRVTPAQADALVGLGRAHLALGRATPALAPLEQADAFWREFDADNRWAGEAALWLGRCYLALGRNADADAALGRAASILARSPIPADIRLVKLARRR
jgi:serine/threonine-protein kinase